MSQAHTYVFIVAVSAERKQHLCIRAGQAGWTIVRGVGTSSP